MLNGRHQIDKIIITAMDRFVWFVLLVVMSHLVTEFTRVTGYTRGSRNEANAMNDSLIQAKQVQNLILLPGQEYGLYQQRPNQYGSSNSNNNMQANAPITVAAPANNQQGFMFSLRPLIDSIFEIPISTLRAVNNLVARLTGNYQQTPGTSAAAAVGPSQPRSAPSATASIAAASRGLQSTSAPMKPIKRSLLRELSA